MQSLFFKAATLGNQDTLKRWVNVENVNIQHEKNGYTLLCFACANNHIESVKLLLKQKADINIQTQEEHYTALILATINGHEKVVELLLEQETIDVNLFDKMGNNALMHAVIKGNALIVEKLITLSNISHINSNGDTVFHLSENANINDILVKHLPRQPR